MNSSNPTRIRLGMTGNFYGLTWRVVGRAVLGEMEPDGCVYYWNEFNLETGTGEAATLVFEQTERGAEWRWFTMFDPEFPITAEDAATKRLGDPINLDGDDVRVTLIRHSRVYFVEGKPPEGERVGTEADYFNAEAGHKMAVVSWTGPEVECYHGITITSGMVASGLNLHAGELLNFRPIGGGGSSPSGLSAAQLFVIAGLLVLLLIWAYKPEYRPPSVVEYSMPSSPLTVGRSGNLTGTNYRIVGHAYVEIAEVGVILRRHEYYLRDDAGSEALLVFGLKPDAQDWCLFKPLIPASPLTPQQAGNVRLGQTVDLGGITAPVSELFRSSIQGAEAPDLPGLKAGDVFYGFMAQADHKSLLARWNEQGILFHQGEMLPAKAVTAAFGQPAK